MDTLTRPSPSAGWTLRPWRRLTGFAQSRHGLTPARPATPAVLRTHAPSAADRLTCTYAGSLLDVALRLEALRDGSGRPWLRASSIAGLVEEVAAELEPLARRAGLRLLHLPGQATPAQWVTDKALLRLVLRHLALRALVGEVAPGAVRMDLALTPREARVRVLSRAVVQPGRQRALDGVSELSALQRLLAAFGGALVIEPRRGGLVSLDVVLRIVSPEDQGAALRRAA